jgi:diguanylate cyclase
MLLTHLEQNNKNTLRLIIDSIDALIYVIDAESYEILYANQKCLDEFGKILGQKCFSVLQNTQEKPCEGCPLSHPNIPETTYKWEHTNTKNNKTYLFSDRFIQLENRLIKMQIGIDITTQKILESKMEQQQQQMFKTFETFTNSTIEALIIQDENKKCFKVNKVAPKLFGYETEEMIGISIFDFISKESLTHVKKVIQNADQAPYEAIMKKKDGSTFPALVRGKDFTLNDKPIRVSAILDITHIKAKEEIISQLAYYDPLTSLPNRILLSDRVNQLLLKNQRTKHIGALMFIDLDHFKIINDTRGHIAGDQILVECAKRLQNVIRSYDTISRFGGDEFILLIDTRRKDRATAINDISIIANKILGTFEEPFYIDTHSFQLGASIGISLFQDDITFEDALKQADSAMYHSKDSGRNRFNLFDPKLQKKIERKALILETLRTAIQNQEVEIYYQKQVNHKQNIVGVEALARWYDKTLGFISPVEFIPIAEESGLIVTFGNYLIEESAKLLSKWSFDKEKKNWRLSINISLKQFEQDNFEYFIEKTIKKYNLEKNKLRIEITESILLKNAEKALEKINFLKQLGISISIDDFGTGYSSLSYLKKLSVDELKIDKSFVEDILVDENDETIILAIMEIANKFGFDVIAEGVETEEIYKKLKTLGCTFFQGYYFAKPLPLSQI